MVREETPIAKADSVARVVQSGGRVHTSTEIEKAWYEQGKIALSLSGGQQLQADTVIVQIGFLSAKETFQRLDVRLNDDGITRSTPILKRAGGESLRWETSTATSSW